MSVEEIIQEIVSKCPSISREQVMEALKEEKHATAGLVGDPILLRLIAAKHGLRIPSQKTINLKLSSKVLVPKLNDVTISGRIIAIYPPRTFEGKKSGKFASLIFADKDGFLRTILWNDKVSVLESGLLRVGNIVLFSHAYTREDRNGKIELHLGEKSTIEINPDNLKEEDYPSIEETATKISKITREQHIVNVSGRARRNSDVSSFTRPDQTSGKMLRFILSDETGELTVIAWNEKAEELGKKPIENSMVRLVNAKVRASSDDRLELHADSTTFIEIFDDQPYYI